MLKAPVWTTVFTFLDMKLRTELDSITLISLSLHFATYLGNN